ncbi:MAG: segregation/condensation protein A [Fimbriimonadales bacterium]|nr:segregation/condensation protein A [Fimbriimonadales bacterium]
MAPRRELASVDDRIHALGIVSPPPIQVESPRFTGSLATLFLCVRERRVDLRDVPLAPICEAYLRYLIEAPHTDFDEAATALLALSYLVERKAWILLPSEQPEPELEEQAELIEPSTHLYREAIEALRSFEEQRQRLFFRPADAGPDPYEIPFALGSASPADLARALQRVLARAHPEPMEPPARPRRSLAEQMRLMLALLDDRWRRLSELLRGPFRKADAVFAFLALLELLRLGQAAVRVENGEAVFSRAGVNPKG